MIKNTMQNSPAKEFAIEKMRAEARDALNSIYWAYEGAVKLGINPKEVKRRQRVRHAWLIFNVAADELERLGGD